MCNATKGHELGGMDCSSGKKRTQSFTHGLDELVGKSRVWFVCVVLVEMGGRRVELIGTPGAYRFTVTN